MNADSCGTYNGQQKHMRDGTISCDDCLLAAAKRLRWTRARVTLGMPRYRRGARTDSDAFQHEQPPWADRPELSDLPLLGPLVHDFVRWSA